MARTTCGKGCYENKYLCITQIYTHLPHPHCQILHILLYEHNINKKVVFQNNKYNILLSIERYSGQKGSNKHEIRLCRRLSTDRNDTHHQVIISLPIKTGNIELPINNCYC